MVIDFKNSKVAGKKLSNTILVVEDNQEIMLNMKIFLKCNGYTVHSGSNGKEALEVLENLPTPPNLILSDIMMPEMNGYDFLQSVSDNPDWNLIPFIFLTAKTSPADIRFANTLGIDDYITKPFNDEDLLATIERKIIKGMKYRQMSEKIRQSVLESLDITIDHKFQQKKDIILFYVMWDEDVGPKICKYYPIPAVNNWNLQEIGAQLFQTTVSIYGHSKYYESQSVLLRISNIEKDGYLYFDCISDESVRGGERQFMLVALAPKINYLMSLRLKEILDDISRLIKTDQDWEIPAYWEKISEILTVES
jgi:CheY-like chemotaxis protein